MPDISIWVAVISGGGAVLGASVSPLSVAYQTVRKAERDRRERRETEIRRACTGLLKNARNLRVQVANNHAYQGNDISPRLEQVRQLATDAASTADSVLLLVPPELSDSAGRLAVAARQLAETAEGNIDRETRKSIRAPGFDELDGCIADFSKQAADYMTRTFGG